MARKREKEGQERKTTPELPDQVIAVRCQSAAERGVGRERRDMRRIRAVCDREKRQSGIERPVVVCGWFGAPAWP